jgi:zinc transporter, ZIP family
VIDAVAGLPPVVQVLLATGFTWGMTALGAGLVFFTKEVKRYVLDAMLGFAAGVMIAASYFSLLAPAVEFAEAGGGSPWIPAVVGFLGGGIFLRGLDRVLPHLHPRSPMREAEGIKTSWQRSVLLVSAITLHNIPEGLARGGRLRGGSGGDTRGARGHLTGGGRGSGCRHRVAELSRGDRRLHAPEA